MKFKYTITGIDCPNCAGKLAGILSAKEGIESAKINFLTEKLTIESELDEKTLLALVKGESKKFDKNIEIEN